MSPRVKYHIIYRHRQEYPVAVMCQLFGVSRSGYYGFCKRISTPEPDAELAELLKGQQERCRQTYGYRRMWLWLEKQGIHHNSKTVLRVMKKYELLAEIRRAKKWVQLEEQTHKYENLLNRDFHAAQPNRKWVTDISYIHTGQGVLYLSMIRDLYDNSIVAYKTATQQTVNLVLDTIRLARRKEKVVAGKVWARRKILCKRFSTKSRRLALQRRSSLPAESLGYSIPPRPGRYARRLRRECRPGGGGILREGVSHRSVRRTGSPAG